MIHLRRIWLIRGPDVQTVIAMTRRIFWSSPSPSVENETMEDDIIDPIDLVDPVIPDHIPRDTSILV